MNIFERDISMIKALSIKEIVAILEVLDQRQLLNLAENVLCVA